MDDQSTYLINGLLTRQFGVGRVVRFREVARGRQAKSLELFTAEEKEYLVQLYPPAFATEQLEGVAEKVNRLDAERFTVVPYLRMKGGAGVESGFVGEGPQGTRMMLSVAPTGSAMAAGRYTDHDISQVGLRLGWMHRLLKEQCGTPVLTEKPLGDRLDDALFEKDAQGHAVRPAGGEEAIKHLRGLLGMPVPQGWVHGDVQAECLLHDNDHQLRTVMDWGMLHWGCPLEDLVDAFVSLGVGREGELDAARGRSLLEAYDTLVPIKKIAWTPIVAWWVAQRVVDHFAGRRPMGEEFFATVVRGPERLATAMASCV